MALDEFTWPLACSGIALAIFSLTLYHRLVKWIGPARLCRFGLVAGVVPALLLPIASLFTQHKVTALVSSCLRNSLSASDQKIIICILHWVGFE